jgi:hypothetical protein
MLRPVRGTLHPEGPYPGYRPVAIGNAVTSDQRTWNDANNDKSPS